ncbi:hypothetical protein ACXYMX_10250 [Sporosarcina sp. CAU 1771]
MSGKSYSDKASVELGKETDWAKVADNAAKKAEIQLDKIKSEAQELIQKETRHIKKK